MFYNIEGKILKMSDFFEIVKSHDTREEGVDYVVENDNKRRVESLDGIECELCLNKEYILRRTEEGSIVSKECSCVAVRRNKAKIERSNLRVLLQTYTFDKYQTKEKWQEDIKELAIKYFQNGKGWFYISGQVGSGKTHVAVSILNEFIKQNKSFDFLSWRDDTPILKGYIYNDFMQYEKMVRGYKSSDVLVIDDLFKGSSPTTVSEADLRLAFEIINARYNTKKLTIITSEHTLQELKKFDEAIGSRIIEMARNSYVAIKKDSRLNIRERREYFD